MARFTIYQSVTKDHKSYLVFPMQDYADDPSGCLREARNHFKCKAGELAPPKAGYANGKDMCFNPKDIKGKEDLNMVAIFKT